MTITVGSGSGYATFSVCGGFLLQVAASSTVVTTCGSVTVKVVSGSARIGFGSGLDRVDVSSGGSAKVTDGGANGFLVANLGPVAVVVTVDGKSAPLGPGSSTTLRPWRFAGFAQPVDNMPTLNRAKAGQAIPIKWRLLDAAGAPVTNLTNATLTVSTLTCSLGMTVDAIEETVAGESGLQALGSGYYQMNWKPAKTYANSCKVLHLSVGDGVTHDAGFQFPK